MTNIIFLILILCAFVSCSKSNYNSNANLEADPTAFRLGIISSKAINENENYFVNLNLQHSNAIPREEINYYCIYNQVFECHSLPGFVFNDETRQISWRPDFSQSGVYDFKLGAYWQDKITEQNFTITVNDIDAPPVLDFIANQTVLEGTAISIINVDDSNSASDVDSDGDVIRYQCHYDNLVNNSVQSTSPCSLIPGLAFDVNTAIMSWTPNFTQAGNYEFKITGTSNSKTDSVIFNITVTNLNRSPELSSVTNQAVNENTAITSINLFDTNTNSDSDIDGDQISYQCFYDNNIDGSVSTLNLCSSLQGLTFNLSSGLMSWIPNFQQSADYEFMVRGSDGVLYDDTIFSIQVTNIDAPPVLFNIANQTVSENAAITQINANDQYGFGGNPDLDADGQTITYSCYYDLTLDNSVSSTNACTDLNGLTFNTATGILNWNTDYSQSAHYEFMIIGESGSLTDQKIFRILVTNRDHPPVLATFSAQTINEGESITQVDSNDVNGTDFDYDGDPINYSCSYTHTYNGVTSISRPCSTVGLTIVASSGIINWTTNFSHAGVYDFSIRGTSNSLNDTQSLSITVNNVNRAPSLSLISDASVMEGDTLNPVIHAQDVNGGNSDIDSDTLSFSCFYDTVEDDAVSNTTSCSNISTLNFSETDGTLSWSPAFSEAGVYEFKIIASDSTLTDEQIFTINVLNFNRPPEIPTISNITVTEKEEISLHIEDINGGDDDIDGDPISFSCYYNNDPASTVPGSDLCSSIPNFSFNTSTGVLEWIPDYDQSGSYRIRIVASDGTVSDTQLFTITVQDDDRPPTLADISDISINEYTPISFDLNDNQTGTDLDIDGDTIIYACLHEKTSPTVTASANCSDITGLTFDSATGVFNWETSASDIGTHQITVSATSKSETATEVFNVTISNTDLPPAISGVNASYTINEYEEIAFNVNDSFSNNDLDRDGQPISYSCFYDAVIDSSVDEALAQSCSTIIDSFNASTGAFSWTPDFGDIGIREYKIIATDGVLSDSHVFTIEVSDVNLPPVLATTLDKIINENEELLIDFNDQFTNSDLDRDMEAISYICYYGENDPSGFTPTNTCDDIGINFNTVSGEFEWTPTFTQSETYTIQILAESGLTPDLTESIFNITVNNVDRAPSLVSITPSAINEGSVFTHDFDDEFGFEGNNDQDIDGDTISYSCFYTTNPVVTDPITPCHNHSRIDFTSTSGVLSLSPNYSDAATFKFKIIASSGSPALTDEMIFNIVVSDFDAPPTLNTVANFSLAEGNSIPEIDFSDSTTNTDFDPNGDIITYACPSEVTIAGITNTVSCSSIDGLTFDTNSGVLNWTTTYDQEGVYAFTVTGTSSPTPSDSSFTISVLHSKQVPQLADISNIEVFEGASITAINAYDVNSGGDTNGELEPLTYTCYFDTSPDNSVLDSNECSSTNLLGMTFDSSTGVLNWTPHFSVSKGDYEFRITASDNIDTDSKIFEIKVKDFDFPPEIISITNITAAEGTAIAEIDAEDTHQNNDFDRDNESITYTCFYDNLIDGLIDVDTASPCVDLGATLSIGGELNWTPNYTQSGDYELIITGSSGSPAQTHSQIFTIVVDNTDHAPSLANISNQTTQENTSISIDANDSFTSSDIDRNGDTISYTCFWDNTNNSTVADINSCDDPILGIEGLTFDGATGALNWTPAYNQSGTYEFKITGSDGTTSDSQIFTIEVENVDFPLDLTSVANQTVDEDDSIIQIDINESNTSADIDRNNTAITYSCSYSTPLVTNDACSNLGITFDASSGVIDWKPDFTQSGIYNVTVSASAGTHTASTSFSITVNDVPRPAILSAITDQTVTENNPITEIDVNDHHTSTDTDREGNTITYSCEYNTGISCSLISGLSFDTSTGVINWTPNFLQSGIYDFVISGTSSTSATASTTDFTITVNNQDRPPVLTSVTDITISENNAITTINVNDTVGFEGNLDSDKDGDIISYSCLYINTLNPAHTSGRDCAELNTSSNFSFIQETGILDWTPSYFQEGNYSFTITGTANSASATTTFSILVNDTNRPPALETISDLNSLENVLISINADDQNGFEGNKDKDIDGQNLTYSCTYDLSPENETVDSNSCTLLTNLTFNTSSGELEWTPDYGDRDIYQFRISASDGLGGTDSKTFAITVSKNNRAPSISSVSAQTVEEESSIVAINLFDTNTSDDIDIDGDIIEYSCYYDTTQDSSVDNSTSCVSLSGLNFDSATGAITWTPNLEQAATYEFKVIATDMSCSTITSDCYDETLFNITVTDKIIPPDLSPISVLGAIEDTSLIFNANDSRSGNDSTIELHPITYTCHFDQVADGNVAEDTSTECNSSNLDAFTFNTSSGVATWTPNFDQAGTYEFKITGTATTGSDTIHFNFNVANKNRPPVLESISNNLNAIRGETLTIDANDSHGYLGNMDRDRDNDPITYSCFFDNTFDNYVGEQSCSFITPGFTFNSSTGELSWTTPVTSTYSDYEFKIRASDSTEISETRFRISLVEPFTLKSADIATTLWSHFNSSIADFDDSVTGNDTHNSLGITYSCTIKKSTDLLPDLCTNLLMSFSTTTGQLSWTPQESDVGSHTVVINATNGTDSTSHTFSLIVKQSMIISTEGNGSTNELVFDLSRSPQPSSTPFELFIEDLETSLNESSLPQALSAGTAVNHDYYFAGSFPQFTVTNINTTKVKQILFGENQMNSLHAICHDCMDLEFVGGVISNSVNDFSSIMTGIHPALITIDASNWDTSSGVSFHQMSLSPSTTIDFQYFDFSSAVDIGEIIPVESFNLSMRTSFIESLDSVTQEKGVVTIPDLGTPFTAAEQLILDKLTALNWTITLKLPEP